MAFDIHPSAIENFNKKAQELIFLIKEFTQNSSEENDFPTDLYISANLTEDDIIGEVVTSTTNNNGETIEKFFSTKYKIYGLREEDYKELKKVSERIQSLPAFTKSISLSYIEEKLFEWIKLKFLEKDSNILFMKYLENEIYSDIKPLIVWIPINDLFVETPFLIGKSHIIPLSKVKIDDWEGSCLETSNSEQKEIKEEFKLDVDTLRRNYQGLACVVTQIEAEQIYAIEYALEQAQKVTSIIGILSGAVLVPNAKSTCQIKGSESIAKAITFFEVDNKLFRIREGSIEKSSSQALMINRELIEEFINLGLNRISDLLAKDQESLLPFENKVLNFLFLYSKASFTNEPVEKLVYVLSALESILLKNDNEPIQQNLGERLAFFTSDKLEERKTIIKNLKSVYTIRSKYVHHGSSSSDLESIQEFLFFVFRFFIMLIHNFHLFNQKEDFLNYIDDKKLS